MDAVSLYMSVYVLCVHVHVCMRVREIERRKEIEREKGREREAVYVAVLIFSHANGKHRNKIHSEKKKEKQKKVYRDNNNKCS